MIHHFDTIQKRYDYLSQALASPSLDSQARQALQKELSLLTGIVKQMGLVHALKKQREDNKEQRLTNSDPEMDELFDLEGQELDEKIAQAEQVLDQTMITRDEHDDRSVFLEIRSGAGGQEASLFAADLMKMYTNYAENQGWHVSLESESHTDLGGYREVVLHIKGKDVYRKLKQESGVHRVQRVPATETQGRVHTSTATVAVLPEAKEVDVQINPADVRVDVYRASGAGGQHVNTTDSAVRLTHIPTNVVVTCQDERSQHKNKARAMKILQSRILMAQKEKQAAEMSKNRKALVGGGMRSEKVRTYNYPQNRITDHQVELTLKKLDMVMLGQLGEIIDALIEKERTERKQEFINQFLNK
jgi:peptide chain release factor 1